MGDESQHSKKRAAGRELSRDNPGLDDEEDVPEQDMGTFKKASDEVLSSRRIVKVRRQQTSTARSSNPFAGIRLVPPPAPAPAPADTTNEAQAAEEKVPSEDTADKDETNMDIMKKDKGSEETPGETAVEPTNEAQAAEIIRGELTDNKDETNTDIAKDKGSEEKPSEANEPDAGDPVVKEAEPKPTDEKEVNGSAKKIAEADEKQMEDEKAESDDKKKNENPDASGSVGAPLSSFQQLSNSQNAFTGLASTGFPGSAFSFGSIPKNGSSSLPTFSFSSSNNGTTPLCGTTGSSTGSKSEGNAFRPMQEVPRETGEENEETVFSADSALFEFLDGGWKERGKGEVKVNVSKSETPKARLVMRAKGNLRLILNSSIYPDMKLTKMDKKGVTFPCVNNATEGKDGLSTFALKFKDSSIAEEFSTEVTAHKGRPATALKTPENSPKASDD